MGELVAAATAYQRLGATATSLRLQWQGSQTQAERRTVAGALLAQLRPSVAAALARDALILIERLPIPVTAEQGLIVARRAAQTGRNAQAADAYAAAARAMKLSSADRFTYGNVLSDLNRWPEASVQFRGVTDPALAGHAAYFHARALLRAGKGSEAVHAMERVVTSFPRDTVAAGTALYLLGDLAIDAGEAPTARRWFAQRGESYPTNSFAPRAALLAALIEFAAGNTDGASTELARGIARYPRGAEADAFRYWLARAHLASDRRPVADSILRAIIDRGPESYYATRAAARLDTVPWMRTAVEPVNSDSSIAALRRARLLEQLGLDVEARFELDHLMSGATSPDAATTLGEARSSGQYGAGDPARTPCHRSGAARDHAHSAHNRAVGRRAAGGRPSRGSGSPAGSRGEPPGVGVPASCHVTDRRPRPDAGDACRRQGTWPLLRLCRPRPCPALAARCKHPARHASFRESPRALSDRGALAATTQAVGGNAGA